MRKKLTFEPLIIQYLEDHGNSHIDVLISSLREKTGVPEGKIGFRINKMITQKKLESDNKVISIKNLNTEQLDQEPDEIFEYGPIKIARKGRIISYESKWRKGEHEKFVQSVAINLPRLEKNLNQKFSEIENFLIKSDPLDVLAYVSANNLMVDPETYTESSFEGRQLYPEIIQNIILKNKIEIYKTDETQEGRSQIKKLLDELYKDFLMYIGYKIMIRKDISDVEQEILFHVLQNFLIGRGDAYPQHYKQITIELFSNINDILKQKGFTIEEYWSTVEEIGRQINYNYNEPIRKLRGEHDRFLDFIKEDEKQGKSPKETIERYQKDLDSRRNKIQPELNKLYEILRKGSFQVKINEKVNQKLLDLLSMEFGNNASWNSPLDKSDISRKPIIKVNGEYYCFLWVHMIRNVISIIESLFADTEREQMKYHDIKGNFFEEKASILLAKLTNGKLYPRLKYPKDNEIDGIIVLKDLVFLIEVKGKKKRVVAGVNDVLKLTKEDFKAHINEAYEQTIRAFKYIQSKEVEFKDEKGTIALKLRKDYIKKVYLINVCVDNFSKLALDINLVKSWDPQIFKGGQNPWVVNIYDLIIISDMLENQSEAFISYLDQRIEVAANYDLKAVDEIDFLGYFLEHGNLNKEANLKILKNPLIIGYSEKIDRWYSYLRGEVEATEKPMLKKS